MPPLHGPQLMLSAGSPSAHGAEGDSELDREINRKPAEKHRKCHRNQVELAYRERGEGRCQHQANEHCCDACGQQTERAKRREHDRQEQPDGQRDPE